MNPKKTPLLALLFFLAVFAGAYEVTLTGGARMDIPEAWQLSDGETSIPSWYSPDNRSAVDVMLWAPGTWDDMQAFVDETKPHSAEGDAISFPCWGGEAALADWTFEVSGSRIRGWFLLVRGDGPDVRVSAIAAEEDFSERQPFLLSVIDSYMPSARHRLVPGAVGRFLELGTEVEDITIRTEFQGKLLEWVHSPAADAAAQDVIEREAIVLSSYATVPELFYPAWERYYRMIYRDGYSRLNSLAEALDRGPLPGTTKGRDVAESLLAWMQGFEYGSTDGFSDLLAPSAACREGVGDCDSLALALMMILDRYGVDSRLILTHQAHHAIAGLDLEGEGLRYTGDDGSWLVAELTTKQALGTLPSRLDGVSDWFSIDLLTD